MHVCYLHKQSNDGWISPMINAVKRHFVFAFRFGFFFLPFKITKSQSFGSISFVNIYSYISSYNRRKGMPGLFNCQLTKRFLHSVLCCCVHVETLKKNDPWVSYHGFLMELHVLVRILLQLCEHKLLSLGYCQLCTKWESNGATVFVWLSFSSSPQGHKQTYMLARHRLQLSAHRFNKFGSKSLCLFHIDLKKIFPNEWRNFVFALTTVFFSADK